MNDEVELHCDPIGQSPIEIIWFKKAESRSGSNLEDERKMIGSGMDSRRYGSSRYNTVNQFDIKDKYQDQEKLFAATIDGDPSEVFDLGSSSAANSFQNAPHINNNNKVASGDVEGNLLGSFKNDPTRFVIKQTKRHDSAEYTCLASNRFGHDEKVIKLFVQGKIDDSFFDA